VLVPLGTRGSCSSACVQEMAHPEVFLHSTRQTCKQMCRVCLPCSQRQSCTMKCMKAAWTKIKAMIVTELENDGWSTCAGHCPPCRDQQDARDPHPCNIQQPMMSQSRTTHPLCLCLAPEHLLLPCASLEEGPLSVCTSTLSFVFLHLTTMQSVIKHACENQNAPQTSTMHHFHALARQPLCAQWSLQS
jgi:hypothetical protein